MTDELNTNLMAEPTACPFVAFEDDRDHRSDAPDYRHRCFASAEPEPRAFPHQERYCLSGGFTGCPVFLDWARQEAAGITRGSTPAAETAVVAAAAVDDDESAPSFLSSRSRSTTPSEPATASRRSAEASAGLWSSDVPTRRVAPTAPPPPSSLNAPQVAMARRGPTHPGWENPPRLESFPRLRSRDERHGNAVLIGAVVVMAGLMVALVLLPVLLSGHGATATPSHLANASASIEDATPTPTETPTAGPTAVLYTVSTKDVNLTRIAADHNVTVQMIVQYNATQPAQYQIKNPNVIFPSMQFYIPPPGWTPPPDTPVPSTAPTPTPTPTPGAS